MTDKRWQEIENLYHSALAREPTERAAFLLRSCAGDEALRQEVESLLANEGEAKSFIEAPALEVAAKGMAEDRSQSLIGGQVGSFKVLSLLGVGGMGEVYLGEDQRLDRTIALKILPTELASDPERMRRFIREAKAASALKHPNVATIYEIGACDGLNFIAMEYVEGQTLATKINSRPLDVAEVVEIGLQTADALDQAHTKGITHRDIKPANLMLTPRSQVKVLDFGLAKVTRPEGQAMGSDISTEVKTETGVVMGTVQYMSPEQVLGRDVDHRTDIFSLGVVLYEMATGRLPFSGNSVSETTDRILHGQPDAIARFNYNAPPELERIIRKCLEKDRERRYQSARDLLVDLRNLKRDSDSAEHAVGKVTARQVSHLRRPIFATSAVAILTLIGVGAYRLHWHSKAMDSLAILPFVNESADPNMEYLSDGITESLIRTLSQLPNLRVMARSTVFRYKGKDVDPQKVGQDLHVQAAVTGRVQQRDNILIIAAEMVDVEKGSQLWGGQYTRKVADIFAVQEEISKEISDKLQLRLTGEEQKRLTKRYTENPEAFEAYLKGRYHWNKRTEEGFRKGIEYFQQAIEKDPSYGLAYAGMADTYAILGLYRIAPFKEAMLRTKSLASRALQIDEKLAEAHNSLAFVSLYYDWDWLKAEREFKRAIELNPNYATAHQWYATFYEMKGWFGDALAERNRAREIDPLSLAINAYAGRAFHFARQYDQAIEQLRQTLDMDPNFAQAHSFLGQAYLQKKMYEEAVTEFRRAKAISRANPGYLSLLGYAYALTGNKSEALKLLAELTEQNKQTHGVPYCLSVIYTGLGEKEQALGSLQKAYEERDPSMIHLKVEPIFDSLRPHPRFQDLLRRMNFPP
jgi:eukaryotic-like serine/threonine-protein kinase